MRTSKFDFNALSNIDDIYEIKVLLCYFLKKINRPVTPNQLFEIATGSNLVNYFAYNHAVDSMLESGLITVAETDGAEYYTLTERGLDGAEEFKTMTHKSSRERILAAGLKFFAKLKDEQTVSFEITETDKGCEVRCTCVDSGTKLLDITLFAPDMEQAEFIRNKIMLNPSAFYSKLMDSIFENEEYVPDISE